MKIISKILLTLLALFVLLLIAGGIQTYRANHSSYQEQFLKGTDILPNGFQKGTADFYKGSWQGKTFDTKTNTGINNFGTGAEATQKYPFNTSLGKGLRDGDLDVVKIDYDNGKNPFWVSPVLDEIVQVAPGEYLGKIHYRLIPGFPFTLGYFRLGQNEGAIRNITVKADQFAIKLPQNWKVDFEDAKEIRLSELIANSPDLSIRTENNTRSFQSGAQLTILVEHGQVSLQEKIEGTILNEEPVTFAGATTTLTTFTAPNIQLAEILDARLFHEGNGYIFRMSYNPQNFRDAKQFFKDVLTSFRFIE